MSSAKAEPQPPYMAASLFKGTLDSFVDSVVPTALDRHVLGTMSGANYGSLMSGLRFLGLIEPTGTKPTDKFKSLVRARKEGSNAYQAALFRVLTDAYEGIVGKVDLDRGTLADLERSFREAGVPAGQMLQKTVRFYVKMLLDSGIPVSPYITKPRRPTNGSSKKTDTTKATVVKKGRGKVRHEPGVEPPHEEPEGPPVGFGQMPIPGVDNAFIQYPKNLTEADCAMFEAVVGVLRTYVQGRSGRKEKTS